MCAPLPGFPSLDEPCCPFLTVRRFAVIDWHVHRRRCGDEQALPASKPFPASPLLHDPFMAVSRLPWRMTASTDRRGPIMDAEDLFEPRNAPAEDGESDDGVEM